MKKLYAFFLLFSVLGSNYSFADCVTGYACSIEGLQAKNFQLEEQFIKELNEYFELNINEDFMLGKTDKEIEYKDFFPFTIIMNNTENGK